MGNSTSRVVGCFVPFNGKGGVDLDLLEPLDEGLGHSFCYVRPMILDSPAITPSNSERFTCFPETTFKAISGASVSANVSTARTGNSNALFTSDAQEPAASFESTSSFAAIPLQPVPRGSGPLNGFMSGPLERGVMSGPLDATDKSNFSAPLAHGRRRPGLQRLMRSVSGPMKSTLSRTFSRHSIGSSWMQRKTHNLQWAHGKAGEDRVHVVLSEEQGWLFIGIYDGFSGPDAPDFLMSHLYKAIDKELEGLLWDYEEKSVNDLLNLELPMNRDATNHATQELSGITALTPGVLGVESIAAPTANLTGQGRKSKRLYELLQMESWDGESSLSVSEGGNQRRASTVKIPPLQEKMAGSGWNLIAF
ncbi:unnamed protein product, partial [Vitis vinifera]